MKNELTTCILDSEKINSDLIRAKMNESGKLRQPFLFAVDFSGETGFFIEYPLTQKDVLFRTPLGTNEKPGKPSFSDVEFNTSPISFNEYKKRFDKVMAALKRGDTYLVNLTVRTPVETNLSLKEIFQKSSSLFALLVPGQFVCFSPERFVRISGGVISTNPMKGTIRADIPNAENLIRNNTKEAAEHSTVVDLLRNDLSIVASDVEVKRFRYTDKVKTMQGDILQVSSEIIGRLPDDYHSQLGDILFSMLPAGSVTGAPKKSTMEIIRNAEPEERGFYTGIFGYYDGNELDSGVLIRFIAQSNEGMFFHSGGGITAMSNAESEYNEVLQKIYLPFR